MATTTRQTSGRRGTRPPRGSRGSAQNRARQRLSAPALDPAAEERRLQVIAVKRRVREERQLRQLANQLSREVIRTGQRLRLLWLALGVDYGEGREQDRRAIAANE